MGIAPNSVNMVPDMVIGGFVRGRAVCGLGLDQGVIACVPL